MTMTTSALGGQGESDHAWRGAPQLLRGYRFRPRAGKFAFCQSAAHMMMGANAQHLDCNGQATPRDRGAAHWSTPNFAPNWNAAATDFASSGALDLVECGFKILSGCTTTASRIRSFAARAPSGPAKMEE